MSATVAVVAPTPWATNDGREWITHVAARPALRCAVALDGAASANTPMQSVSVAATRRAGEPWQGLVAGIVATPVTGPGLER
jgi:hypothetical protein